MSNFQQKPNRGSLFVNNKKSKPSDPDYNGSAVIEGVGEVYLSGWKQQSKNGTSYLSISVKPKGATQGRGNGGYQQQPRQQQAQNYTPPAQQFTADDIPF